VASVPNSSLVSDQVFTTLLEAVLSGRYEPGEKLPRQRELAADLGVTLGSLREALKRLEQMSLLEVRHGDATRVNDWRTNGGLDVIAHVLFLGGGVDATVLHNILEARTLMLREIAALAAHRRSDEQAQRLEELAVQFADAPDAIAAAHVDFAFFTEIAQAAGNLVFVLILNTIRQLYFAHLAGIPVTARPEELAPEYGRIAAAVAAGAADDARAAAERLAEAQRSRVEELLP
jgi:GntR family transcriptional regulator, transcriptional repressor for pyruvate dehydrogenase complex